MAPSRKNARKARTLKNIKKKKKLDHQEEITNSSICCDNKSVILKKDDEIIISSSSSSVGCTTPKAQRYQIPEILTCPPAPKKKRRISVSSCTLRRTPISFFEPPDIELFFASHLASIYNHVVHTTHVIR